VDIVETLSVTLAPSGRPLAAFANGSIAFTSKISGVPDLVLNLTVPGGKQAMSRVFELPVFHPCVRLARWNDRPGELSFVPPDGKFVLAGYEVNLLPSTDLASRSTKNLNLPVSIEVLTSLGPTGSEFEVRLLISSTFAGSSSSSSTVARPGTASRGSGRSMVLFGGGASSAGPSLQDVVVTIPIPQGVRNVTNLRASRGEAQFTPINNMIEWRIPNKDAASAGNATLRCTVVGPLSEDAEEKMSNGLRFDAANGDYDENEDAYQSASPEPVKPTSSREQQEQKDLRKVQQNAALMPSSAAASFSVKGWLASGIKVEALNVDLRKSRGLGEGVKPVKGVKYLTVSRKGVETRC
jgi:AP-3 complex subunit mu